MSQQKYPKAYEAYQQAVYRDGRNPTFWCSIGVLYYQINQYRDALDAYSRAIRLNPNISEVWYDLGTLVSTRRSAALELPLTWPSTSLATIRQPTRLTLTSVPLTSIHPTSISRLVYNFFRTGNRLLPLLMAPLLFLATFILKPTNLRPSMGQLLHNGALLNPNSHHRARLPQL
jgi:tetratricopeptide (TPR) repeat protein